MRKWLLLFALLLLSQDGTFVVTDNIIDVNAYKMPLTAGYERAWLLEVVYADNYKKKIYYGSGEKWAIEEDYRNIIQIIKYERRMK